MHLPLTSTPLSAASWRWIILNILKSTKTNSECWRTFGKYRKDVQLEIHKAVRTRHGLHNIHDWTVDGSSKTRPLINGLGTTHADVSYMWYTRLPVRHGLPNPIVVCTNERRCSKDLWLQSLSYTFFHWSRPHVGLATPAFLRGWVSSVQFQQNWLIGGHVFLWRNWYVMNHFTIICVYNLSNTSEVLCIVFELHQLNWAPNSSTKCCCPIFKCSTFGTS